MISVIYYGKSFITKIVVKKLISKIILLSLISKFVDDYESIMVSLIFEELWENIYVCTYKVKKIILFLLKNMTRVICHMSEFSFLFKNNIMENIFSIVMYYLTKIR